MKDATPGSDLRDRLIAAALDQLDSGAEISLRSVARAAGVSAMAPYRHFADKEALLAAVAERGFERFGARLGEADRAPDPRAALLAQGLAYVAFAQAHPALFRLMFTGVALGPLPGGECSFAILGGRVRALVPEAADPATLTCWGAVHGIAMLVLDQRLTPPLDGAIERALALLVERLTGPGA